MTMDAVHFPPCVICSYGVDENAEEVPYTIAANN